jgi:hypothetical protein
MPDAAPNAELLRSLAKLIRGLSVLFWGLPLALLVGVWTSQSDRLRAYGFVPPVVALGLVWYGLALLGTFQRQERIWRSALDRTQLLAVINLGLSPFLYWSNKVPGHPFFGTVATLLAATGLIFLGYVNLVLQRLSAMLPDETLRSEMKQFAPVNCILLAAAVMLLVAYVFFDRSGVVPPQYLDAIVSVAQEKGLWLVIPFVLLPLAMTMALIWKTKEAIWESVFGGANAGPPAGKT